MNQTEFLKEIGLSFAHTTDTSCWIDHSHTCPYGLPNGRFENRPSSFCLIKKTLDQYGCDFLEFVLSDILNDEVEMLYSERFNHELDELFKDDGSLLTEELATIIDNNQQISKIDKLTIERAIEIIKELNENDTILCKTDI